MACLITSVCMKLVSLQLLSIITEESDVLEVDISLLSLQ